LKTAVIFDIDGCLTDTLPLIYDTMNATLAPVWGRRRTDAEIHQLFGPPEEVLVGREVGEERFEERMRYFYDHYRRHHAMASVYPGVRETLVALRDAGVGLGVLTNKGRTTALITLRELGLEDFFPAVRTGSEGPAKPEPDGLLAVLGELGADREASVMIGDSPTDVRAGKAAGCQTVGAVWGRPEMRGRLVPLAPTLVTDDPLDVLDLVGVPRPGKGSSSAGE